MRKGGQTRIDTVGGWWLLIEVLSSVCLWGCAGFDFIYVLAVAHGTRHTAHGTRMALTLADFWILGFERCESSSVGSSELFKSIGLKYL